MARRSAPPAEPPPEPPTRALADPDGWRLPPGRSVPDWSVETREAFACLTGLERAFVEWYSTCLNATQAYLQATGKDPEGCLSARQLAYQIKDRQRVKAAIEMALRDRSVNPILDRQYRLTVLREQIEECRASAEPADKARLTSLLRLACEMGGDIIRQQKTDVTHHGLSERSRVSVFISQIVAEATGLEPLAANGDRPASGGPVGRIAGTPVGTDQRAPGHDLAE